MKVLILLSWVTVAYGNILPSAYSNYYAPVTADGASFSIIEDYLIPLGEKIRKAEERMQKQRIVGGTPSTLGQFPYQVGCVVHVNATRFGVCGGSLVSANRVISAAHCYWDGRHQALKFTVVAGSNTIFSGGIRIETRVVVMHPQWTPRVMRNDVSVLYLGTPITFSAIISPIALPSGNELSRNYTGWNAVASGFGQNIAGVPVSHDQFLSHVAVDIISNPVCRASAPNLEILVQNTNICTSGFGGKGVCFGDSGGPLVVISNNRPILLGITSFGSGLGCSSGFPAAYARVTSFMNFFNQHL